MVHPLEIQRGLEFRNAITILSENKFIGQSLLLENWVEPEVLLPSVLQPCMRQECQEGHENALFLSLLIIGLCAVHLFVERFLDWSTSGSTSFSK